MSPEQSNEADEPRMSPQRFEEWADLIGLTEDQRGYVLYVIRREWDRGQRATSKETCS